jgi:uncharacterized protein
MRKLYIRRKITMLFGNKGKDKLFIMLLEQAEVVREASKYFFNFKIKESNHLEQFYNEIKSYEKKGDKIVHELTKELNKSLITPIEREDILHLANSMDDILDGLEQCAARIEMYDIHQVTEEMVEFSQHVNNCSIEVFKCIELLSEKKLANMMEPILKVKEYESASDRLERQAIKKLFVDYKDDAIKIIQYKSIYQTLEATVDKCKNVSKVLETIIMKNA